MKNGRTIEEIERGIIEEFSVLTSWEEKYNRIIQLGAAGNKFENSFRTEENRVKGCQSDIWVTAHQHKGRVYFMADSDSLIVKGLAALLIRVLSGQTADSILKAELQFIGVIGLKQHLSPSRSNGLLYMISKLKSLAMKHRTDDRG